MVACATPSGSTKSVAQTSEPKATSGGRQAGEAPARVEAAERVAGGGDHDRERARDGRARRRSLEADEQDDAAEADEDADEPQARDALAVVDPEGERAP